MVVEVHVCVNARVLVPPEERSLQRLNRGPQDSFSGGVIGATIDRTQENGGGCTVDLNLRHNRYDS